MMTDIRASDSMDDLAFTKYLVARLEWRLCRVEFLSRCQGWSAAGRFAFCKTEETLDEAAKRLRQLKPRRS